MSFAFFCFNKINFKIFFLYINSKLFVRQLSMFSAGYWIGGFGLGETMDERPALLCVVSVRLISYARNLRLSHYSGDKSS